jgi:hypothetical protein
MRLPPVNVHVNTPLPAEFGSSPCFVQSICVSENIPRNLPRKSQEYSSGNHQIQMPRIFHGNSVEKSLTTKKLYEKTCCHVMPWTFNFKSLFSQKYKPDHCSQKQFFNMNGSVGGWVHLAAFGGLQDLDDVVDGHVPLQVVLAEGQQLQKRKQSSTWSCRRGTVAIAFT